LIRQSQAPRPAVSTGPFGRLRVEGLKVPSGVEGAVAAPFFEITKFQTAKRQIGSNGQNPAEETLQRESRGCPRNTRKVEFNREWARIDANGEEHERGIFFAADSADNADQGSQANDQRELQSGTLLVASIGVDLTPNAATTATLRRLSWRVHLYVDYPRCPRNPREKMDWIRVY
jgi:hypothetical protein